MENMQRLLTSESMIQKMQRACRSSAKCKEASERRTIRTKFMDSQFDIEHRLFRPSPKGDINVKKEEKYEVNSRGKNIFTKSWLPLHPPKALIFYCHDYGDTCTFLFEGIARTLVVSGYGVFALDYPGFGLSEGLYGYIRSFDELVDDVIEYFQQITEKENYKNLPKFLFGQSMGAAVALKIHLKQPEAWDGAVLVSPMIKIAKRLVPNWAARKTLIGVSRHCPKLKFYHLRHIACWRCRDLEKKRVARCNILAYRGNPRLGTAVELFKATEDIQQLLQDVSMPLLIMHGDADKLTDPSGSKKLYEKAKTNDKKLLIYQKAFHSILEGEPDHVISQALHDIIYWIDNHLTKNPARKMTRSRSNHGR